MCSSKYVDHSRLNNHPYNHLVSTRIVTFIMNKMFVRAPKNVHMATKWLRHDLDFLIISHELCDILYHTRNGCRGKSIQTTHVYLKCFYFTADAQRPRWRNSGMGRLKCYLPQSHTKQWWPEATKTTGSLMNKLWNASLAQSSTLLFCPRILQKGNRN